MSNMKEIKKRIESVKETQKITNAMYLISSTKLRKAKQARDKTRPYYQELRSEIKRIFRTVDVIKSRYYYPVIDDTKIPGTYAYLVITADRGMAGAYNMNAIKEANRMMAQHEDNELYVIGERGRQYYKNRGIEIEHSFHYSAQNPTLQRAREIASFLLERYDAGKIRKIFLIYTRYTQGMAMEAVSTRLLPFHKAHFFADQVDEPVDDPFTFYPSASEVLDHITPGYMEGFIYSAMVESFCCEQNARLTAMENAGRNAQELLDELSMQYHHMRQAAITQEMAEVVSGYKSRSHT